MPYASAIRNSPGWGLVSELFWGLRKDLAPILGTHYQDGTVDVAHDALGDATHQCPPYATAASGAHRYQSGFYVLGQGDDLLGHPPVS